ncbi:MAG TPA: ferrochelatase [Coriobacteriia bacterium]
MTRTGVLLTAFGGPDCLDAVAPFMCSIMGTEPSDAALTEARRKYLTIGGFSPLPGMAERMAAQLERALNGMEFAEIADGDGDGSGLGMWGGATASARTKEAVRMPVVVGMLHSEPSVESAVAKLVEAGVRQIVHLSLSPFDAEVTTGAYTRAIDAALAPHSGIRVTEAASYHCGDEYVGLYADNLNEALHDADILANKGLVVFTAHSLPKADVEADGSYVDQLRETAAAVAAGVGLGDPSGFTALDGIDAFGGPGTTAPWLLAFQSKGRRGGEWIGPDLDDVVDAAIAAGIQVIIVCPIGFALDHLETLYDLDVCVADRVLLAEREFVRVAAPNADPKMIEALAGAVRKVI